MPVVKPASVAFLLALSAAPALAYEADYPAAADAAGVASWLAARTNIKPASVVTITPGFVVALVGKQKPLSPDGPVRVTLREEVIAPAFVESVGGRSALISAEIQCEERRLRMDGRNLYAGPNLSGAEAVDAPSTEWLRIPEDTVMDEVANAACGADFAWPLQGYATLTPVVAEPSPPAAIEPRPAVEKPVEAAAPAVRYAIQIGAYRNRQLAEAAWKALTTERPVLTEGHDFDTRPVKVKGRELLRGLVLNFKSQEDGAAFCTALAGAGYGCILRVLAD
ncbi:MAG: SPOR domain-containing protein [Parcubacteria group bacterium]